MHLISADGHLSRKSLIFVACTHTAENFLCIFRCVLCLDSALFLEFHKLKLDLLLAWAYEYIGLYVPLILEPVTGSFRGAELEDIEWESKMVKWKVLNSDFLVCKI